MLHHSQVNYNSGYKEDWKKNKQIYGLDWKVTNKIEMNKQNRPQAL